MKLKLDENLGHRVAELLRGAGHDVATVPEQDLCGTLDEGLLSISKSEGRVLVTLDLEFGNPIRFKPSEHAGIVVLRLPSRPTLQDIINGTKVLIKGLEREEISGRLWIVHRGRIRIFEEE